MTEHDKLKQIAIDLEICAIGEAIAEGKNKKKYKEHRAACMAYIKELNERDGLNKLSDDELLKELGL